MCTEDEGLGQIHRIREFCCDDQPVRPIRIFNDIVIFFECRVLTERYTVLSHIPGAHLRRDDLQTSAVRLGATASCIHGLPTGNRVTLPRVVSRGRLRVAEVEQSRLSTRIDIHAQCVLVLPCYMAPSWLRL